MSDQNGILFVVEGAKTERLIFQKIIHEFFGDNPAVITLPAWNNIYAVRDILEKYRPYDIIEALREAVPDEAKPQFDGIKRNDFADFFLFFDLDIHHFHGDRKKAKEEVKELLERFDEETENGKLYLSYPMAESFYSWIEGTCRTNNDCTVPLKNLRNGKKYKGLAHDATINEYANINQYSMDVFDKQMDSFLCRTACLFGLDEMPEYELYKSTCTPSSVFDREMSYIDDGEIFEFSAIPEFLLDYNKKDFWGRHVTYGAIDRDGCSRRP